MAAALSTRDWTTVYRLLQRIGYSQQRIAALTTQSQPEVSAIMNGRRVMAYDVMYRIASGLGIPLHLVGMSSCPVEPAAATVNQQQ
jgi:transcriptional regulator with XRE-family HTH domain